MPCAGRNEDRIARADILERAVHFHAAGSFLNEIKLLAQAMVVALRESSRWHRGFRKRLILHRRISPVEDAPDCGAILGGEGSLGCEVEDGHGNTRRCSNSRP